jgi:hypothetical protein
MAERMGKLPTTPTRFAHMAPDGTIPYFEASDGRQVGGRLPAGSNPQALVDRGYTFVDRDAFTQAQARTTPEYRAGQADVDDLAEAFDMSMGSDRDTTQDLLDRKMAEQGMQANGQGQQQGAEMDPQIMAILQQYMQEGRLQELFQPFQQEQAVLDQQMAMGQQMQQPGQRRATPLGALLGGASDAIGKISGANMQQKALDGQTALSKRMQGDASGRTTALLEMLQRAQGINPRTGLKGVAVGDEELAMIAGGGM